MIWRVPGPPGATTIKMSEGLGHVDQRRIVTIGDVSLGVAAVVDDVEPECAHPGGDRLADAAEPQNAHGASPQRRAERESALRRPLPGAQISLGLRQPAHRHDHQTERGVGDLVV